MARASTVDEPFDVFMLFPDEIRWGFIPKGRVSLRQQVNRRKEEWQKALKTQPSPLKGSRDQRYRPGSYCQAGVKSRSLRCCISTRGY